MALENQAQLPGDWSQSAIGRQRPRGGGMRSSLGGGAAAVGAAGPPGSEVVSTGGGMAPGAIAGGRGESENDGGWASGADKRSVPGALCEGKACGAYVNYSRRRGFASVGTIGPG